MATATTKSKISRPVLYAVVLGAVAYGVVILTEPEAPAKKPVIRKTTTTKTVGADGFTEEDRTARFPRYVALGRNGFTPLVLPRKALMKLAPKAPPKPKPTPKPPAPPSIPFPSGWRLTGIVYVNGMRKALLENGQESVFLQAGETWQGMTVSAIEPNAVSFVKRDGKPHRLTFVDPQEASGSPAPTATPTPTGGR